MKLTWLQEPDRTSLSALYRQKDPAVLSLFGMHPAQPEDWQRRAEWLDRPDAFRPDRADVVQALRQYHSKLPSHPMIQQALERLARTDSLVVVGGQQAGLFGGPLMIFHKARSVIQAARDAERKLGRPVVPVFWIAGEDHDFEEANHVDVMDRDGHVRRIRIKRPAGPLSAVSRTAIAMEDWQAALAELAESLPDTAYKADMLECLSRHTADRPTLSLAFARLLAEWFGPEGLLLLDADDPSLRALESPMFRGLIERNERLEEALQEGERAVTKLAFPLQAESSPGCANLFYHHDAGRLLLYRDGERFADRKAHVALDRKQLLDVADQSPHLLSTNALTRPLMQEFLLPVLACVLGPSELAYWGGLRPAFELFGMRMPVLVPRQSFTYVDADTRKALDKYALTPQMAMEQWEQSRKAWLDAQDPLDIAGTFQAVKAQFLDMYTPVLDKVSDAFAGLKPLTAANRDKILAQFDYLAKRANEALQNRHEQALRQWDFIRTSLMPGGKPQERVLGTVQYWNLYGPEWINLWREVPFEPTGGHRLVEGFHCPGTNAD